jgi:hypothetical protein
MHASAHLQGAILQAGAVGVGGAEVQVAWQQAVLVGQKHLDQGCRSSDNSLPSAIHTLPQQVLSRQDASNVAGQSCACLRVQGLRALRACTRLPGRSSPRSGPCWT